MTRPRPFTPSQEDALVKLARVAGAAFLDITRDRPSTYERLSDRGLATVMLHKRQKRARLTAAGRYFADLLAAREARS